MPLERGAAGYMLFVSNRRRLRGEDGAYASCVLFFCPVRQLARYLAPARAGLLFSRRSLQRDCPILQHDPERNLANCSEMLLRPDTVWPFPFSSWRGWMGANFGLDLQRVLGPFFQCVEAEFNADRMKHGQCSEQIVLE